ncbi:MAG: acyl-CoA dehydrogenase [Acidobacteria bacterium]|nr:MAG: acyl-CoA dehydrogenase [Acidobacteriota bacterium]REK10550.1 MAG: acyl-CoA dehydrogenase [Acidobacteriota bacterium]
MSSDRLRTLLLETSSRLFAQAGEPELQESVDAGSFPAEVWAEIEDNGLPTALLPAERGGADLPWPDALAILRMAGAYALPLPLAETFVAHDLLHGAGVEPPEGPICLALGAPRSPIRHRGGSLSGSFSCLWPGSAHLLLVGRGEDGDSDGATLLEAQEAISRTSPTPAQNAAGEPVGHCASVQTEAVHELPPGTWRSTLELCALSRAMMIAGAMERILDLTIEHVQGREQFGRPIGRFQAVQQQVAEMTGHVALVGVAAEAAGAARAAATDPRDASFECASAKACASELAGPVARTAHQLHAAIGFTREHVLQRFTRRLWTWRDDFGDESFWQQQVGAAGLAAGSDGLWPLLSRS